MKRMLFNATHAEELRVAIVDGQKLIDLDIEIAGKEQRKSNIYKGVITRIEPSLEAAFIEYGEERHGFLPFKEVAKSNFRTDADAGHARIQDALKEGSAVTQNQMGTWKKPGQPIVAVSSSCGSKGLLGQRRRPRFGEDAEA